VDIDPELADRLLASYEDRGDVHHVLCTEFTGPPDFGCSCGVPRLLEDLLALVQGVRDLAVVKSVSGAR
jgi:hypothetical protein